MERYGYADRVHLRVRWMTRCILLGGMEWNDDLYHPYNDTGLFIIGKWTKHRGRRYYDTGSGDYVIIATLMGVLHHSEWSGGWRKILMTK